MASISDNVQASRKARRSGARNVGVLAALANLRQGGRDLFGVDDALLEQMRGLDDQWVEAVRSGDRDAMLDVLRERGERIAPDMFGAGTLQRVTKPLIVTHNLRPDNLRIADEFGGLPMPSIGITSAEKPYSTFGDIKLLGRPEMVDPQRGVPVYPADAYTGRQPRADIRLDDPEGAAEELQRLYPELTPQDAEGYGTWAEDLLEGLATGGPTSADTTLKRLQRMLEVAPDDVVNRLDYRDIVDALNDFDRSFTQGADYPLSKYPGLRALGTAGDEGLYFRNSDFPYTQDEVLAEMGDAWTPLSETGGVVPSAGPFRAGIAGQNRFRDLDSIRAKRGNINTGDEVEWQKDYLEREFGELAARARDVAEEAAAARGVTGVDFEGGDILFDLATQGEPAPWFTKQFGFPEKLKTLQPEAQRIGEFARDMLTEYFEAKPKGVVRLSDFEGALIPLRTDPEIERLLVDSGLNRVKRYAGSDIDLPEVIEREFSDLYFSRGGRVDGGTLRRVL